MAATIQVRRGTASQWTTANPTLAAGEIGFETDTNQFKIGNVLVHREWVFAVRRLQTRCGNESMDTLYVLHQFLRVNGGGLKESKEILDAINSIEWDAN